jgi:hypothetical protein
MSGRSWMAALTLAAGLLLPVAAPADDRPGMKPAQAPPTSTSQAPSHRVKLELRIAGLTRRGCDVEIKPAHPACSFKTVSLHVESRGEAIVDLKDVRSESADRDCSFAITIREPGQTDHTSIRGIRLNPPASTAQQLLSCYLSCPSRIARMSEPDTTRKR